MTSQLPPIYVISLVRETARRENIKQRLTALGANYEFFNAVDGKALQPSQYTHRMQTRHHFLKEGFEMTSGEIGCFMSHHNLWQKIADGKNEYALVLEDDAVWDNDFADVINQVLTCKWHWEVVLLSEYTSTTAGRVLCNLGDNRQLIRRHRRAFTAAAYLISRTGAAIATIAKPYAPLWIGCSPNFGNTTPHSIVSSPPPPNNPAQHPQSAMKDLP